MTNTLAERVVQAVAEAKDPNAAASAVLREVDDSFFEFLRDYNSLAELSDAIVKGGQS